MKKVFAIAIVVAMVLALFVIPSHAGGNLCVDGAYLTNDADVSGRAQPWVPAEGEPNLAGQTKAGDLGNIYNSGFAYFHAQGWWSDDEELSDLGIQINRQCGGDRPRVSLPLLVHASASGRRSDSQTSQEVCCGRSGRFPYVHIRERGSYRRELCGEADCGQRPTARQRCMAQREGRIRGGQVHNNC